MTQQFLTVDEAAREMRSCRNTVFNLMRERRLGFLKVGRKTLIPRAAIEKFIADNQIMPEPAGLAS